MRSEPLGAAPYGSERSTVEATPPLGHGVHSRWTRRPDGADEERGAVVDFVRCALAAMAHQHRPHRDACVGIDYLVMPIHRKAMEEEH